jgi:adenosylcobyric acid synthase
MGRTRRATEATAALRIMDAGPQTDELDGCVSADGRVWGCYLHGLFGNDAFRHAWLGTLGWQARGSGQRQDPYDRLADVVERHLDAHQLAAILGR